MLGITFSPQIYHNFFSLGFKFKENNENDMTFVVWAVIVFGPRVWQLSARCHYVLRGTNLRWRFRKILWPSQKYIKFYLKNRYMNVRCGALKFSSKSKLEFAVFFSQNLSKSLF